MRKIFIAVFAVLTFGGNAATAQSGLPKLDTDFTKQPAGEYIVDKAQQASKLSQPINSSL